MITADEIIDLIRTGYIPSDPGRLGEFGRIVDALNERRSTEPLGECEWCKLGNDPEDGQHFIEREYRRSNERYVACTDPRFNHGKALVMIADQNRTIADIRAQLAAAQVASEGKEVAPNDAYWDQHAVQCGNCGVEILTRGEPFKPGGKVSNGLSDTGDSEDEALCGMCAGIEMYRCSDRLDELQPEFHAFKARISELEQASEARGQEVERLRDALQHIKRYLTHRDDRHEVCYDWCPLCKVEIALATPAATPAVEQTAQPAQSFVAHGDEVGIAEAVMRDSHGWGLWTHRIKTLASHVLRCPDTSLINKLSTMTINFRDPLVYGSRDLGWYRPPFDEEGTPNGQPDIRTRIAEVDAARSAEAKEPGE